MHYTPKWVAFLCHFLALSSLMISCGANDSDKKNKPTTPIVHPEAQDIEASHFEKLNCGTEDISAIHCAMSSVLNSRTQAWREANFRLKLTWHPSLAVQAYHWACHLAELGALTHEGWQDRVIASGFKPGGENVVMINRPESESTADRMFEVLRESPGHNANMLSPNMGGIGVGICRGSKGLFGVQLFSALPG